MDRSPTPHLVVGFSGQKGAGKDTVAGLMAAAMRRRFACYYFACADPLYASLHTMFDLPRIHPRGEWPFRNPRPVRLEKSLYIHALKCTVGEALQTLGTEWGRIQHDPWVWASRLSNRIHSTLAQHTPNRPGSFVKAEPVLFCVPDIRFPEEATTIRNHDGWMVHVDGPSRTDTGDVRDANHSSETQDLSSDFTVFNGGSRRELTKEVDRLLEVVEEEFGQAMKING